MGVTLTTLQLAQLRLHREGSLPDTCTLQTATVTADAFGGQAVSWANTYTSVECRLAPITARQAEQIEGEQVAAFNAYVLTVHHDQAISDAMRAGW